MLQQRRASPAMLQGIAWACLLVISAISCCAAAGLPRGVDPAQAAAYTSSASKFTCLDGSLSIPASQVNDNYCDCPSDGSDEPGALITIAVSTL